MCALWLGRGFSGESTGDAVGGGNSGAWDKNLRVIERTLFEDQEWPVGATSGWGIEFVG